MAQTTKPPATRTGEGVLRAVAFAAAALLLAAAGPLHAQTITFDVHRPPPAQLSFKHLWNISLRNPSLDTWSVYFHVEANDVKVGPVFAATSREMFLAPGESSLTAEDIQLIDVWCEEGFEAFAAPDSFLPEGDYTYCITLLPEMTFTTFLLQVRKPRPIEFLWPRPSAVVRDSLPLFVWNRPVLPWYAGEYRYSVRVAEMRRGQSCSLATNSEATIVEHCRSPQTAWRYPRRAKELIPGRTYAWRVEA